MLKQTLACALCLLSIAAMGQQAAHPAHTAALAKKPVDRAVDSDPALAEAQRLLDKGQLDEALKAANELAAKSPEPKGVERLRGKIYYSQAKFEEADQAFQKAIAADAGDRESIQLRGSTLFRMGKPAEAIPLLEHAHANLPELNLDGTYVLALCYLSVHRYDDSRKAFASMYGLPEDSAPAYLLLAKMLLRWQNAPAAQEMARKALAINPRIPLAHLVLGQAALGETNIDEALKEFEHEAAIDPMDGAVYDRLGDVYLQKNMYEKAQAVLNQAILLEPDATGPYILLGQVLLKRDNPVTAATYLKRAVQMDPGNQYSHYFLGQAYRAMGKKEEAMAEFQASEKIKAKNR
jgi:predicted Zn-dependent protease